MESHRNVCRNVVLRFLAASNLTRRRLADESGVSQVYLYRWLAPTGHKRTLSDPSFERMRGKIALVVYAYTGLWALPPTPSAPKFQQLLSVVCREYNQCSHRVNRRGVTK